MTVSIVIHMYIFSLYCPTAEVFFTVHVLSFIVCARKERNSLVLIVILIYIFPRRSMTFHADILLFYPGVSICVNQTGPGQRVDRFVRHQGDGQRAEAA